MYHLRELRTQKGLTQAELSKALQVSASSIGMYEQGRREPDNETLGRIANFFNVTTDYLLGRTDEPHTIAKGSSSTDLTPKEEREIEHDLEDMINSMASAAYESDNGEQEDIEALQATLRAAMIQAKRIAKKKYTPRKYRKD